MREKIQIFISDDPEKDCISVSTPAALYVKGDQSQSTPKEFFESLQRIFDFQLDAAADLYNACIPNYYDVRDNGLCQPWSSSTWVNPPWAQLDKWIAKAIREAERGNLTVMLCPLRCHTVYWHSLVIGNPRLITYSLMTGLTFGGHGQRYPHPLAVLIFKPDGFEVSEEVERQLNALNIRRL